MLDDFFLTAGLMKSLLTIRLGNISPHDDRIRMDRLDEPIQVTVFVRCIRFNTNE